MGEIYKSAHGLYHSSCSNFDITYHSLSLIIYPYWRLVWSWEKAGNNLAGARIAAPAAVENDGG